jgi:hypothetical protein
MLDSDQSSLTEQAARNLRNNDLSVKDAQIICIIPMLKNPELTVLIRLPETCVME